MAARNEEIAIKIGAKDEASKVIDSLAKKIDGMEADEARITVTAQTDKLEAQLDRAKAKLAGLEGDEATVQARLVGTLEEDLEQANKLLEQLDGQTATVKIDSVGAKQGIDDLGKSADSSKSVLANMVGNATQDLGELGGVAGSAGVAIGQMGEYMADARAQGEGFGSILKGFGTVALPIAGIGLALQGIQKHFANIAQTKAFKTEQIDKWADALREGETLLAAIQDEMESTGRLEFQGFSRIVDMVPILADAGLKTKDWTAAVEGSRDAQIAFIEKIKESGVSERVLLDVMVALENEANNYADAQSRNADVTAVSTEAVEEHTRSHQRSKPVIDDNSAALDRHRTALDKARQKTDDLRLANEKLRGDLDRDEAYLRLQDTFQETEDAGIEAWLAVSAGAADADQVVRAYKIQQIDAKRALDDFITRFGEIPPAKQIEINTLIDEGNFAAAKTEIDKLTEAQVVDVRFNVIRPRSLGVGSAGGGGVPLLAGAMSGIPTGVQIAKQIGPVRIPADVYVRSTPRITGIRDR